MQKECRVAVAQFLEQVSKSPADYVGGLPIDDLAVKFRAWTEELERLSTTTPASETRGLADSTPNAGAVAGVVDRSMPGAVNVFTHAEVGPSKVYSPRHQTRFKTGELNGLL
jgi:hypothetical protein